MRNAIDESLDELIEKKYIEEASVVPDGESICCLTDKAIEHAMLEETVI